MYCLPPRFQIYQKQIGFDPCLYLKTFEMAFYGLVISGNCTGWLSVAACAFSFSQGYGSRSGSLEWNGWAQSKNQLTVRHFLTKNNFLSTDLGEIITGLQILEIKEEHCFTKCSQEKKHFFFKKYELEKVILV